MPCGLIKDREPDFGFLYDHFLSERGSTLLHANYCVPRVKLELVFTLGKMPKRPDISMLDVMRAKVFIIPSIKIINTRADEPRTIYDTIADNGARTGIVLGSLARVWQASETQSGTHLEGASHLSAVGAIPTRLAALLNISPAEAEALLNGQAGGDSGSG